MKPRLAVRIGGAISRWPGAFCSIAQNDAFDTDVRNSAVEGATRGPLTAELLGCLEF